jgi:hypothetical protein
VKLRCCQKVKTNRIVKAPIGPQENPHQILVADLFLEFYCKKHFDTAMINR